MVHRFPVLSILSLFSCLILGMSCEQKSKELSSVEYRRLLIYSLSHFPALPETVKHPTHNPTSPAKVQLGKLLFFDPILSGNKDVACATCHHPTHGFAEYLDLSIGVNGKGLGSLRAFKPDNDIPLVKRNAPTCLNTAFNGMDMHGNYSPEEAPMFWDSRVKSLEKQALEPIKALEEMRGRNYAQSEILPEVARRLNTIEEYRSLFDSAFPANNGITPDLIGKSIACYERSLSSKGSRFDQYMRGDKSALSLSELEGFKTFILAGCGLCHNGPMFSDYQLHAIGVEENDKLDSPDIGSGGVFKFRTPTLRNLRFTDPYMHNGTQPTLLRTLEFYEDIANGKFKNEHIDEAQIDPFMELIELKVKDMRPIINFLNTLNDDMDEQAPEQVPSGLPVGGNI